MQRKQIEIPVHDNPIVTFRSLDEDHPSNSNKYEINQKLNDLIKEVKIRFDTNPDYYQKEDFKKLIQLISGSVKYLQDSNSKEELIILNQKIELLKQKLLEFGTISKEQIDSLFKDLETEVPYPTKTKKYIEETIFDFAVWQKPGAKSGAQVLYTNFNIPPDQNGEPRWGCVLTKSRINSFLVDIGKLYPINVDDHIAYEGIVEIPESSYRLKEEVLHLLQYDKTSIFKYRVNGGNWIRTDNNEIQIPLNSKRVRLCVVLEGSFYSKSSSNHLNVGVTIDRYFQNRIPKKKGFYLLSTSSRFKFDWKFQRIYSDEVKCKYHKLKVNISDSIYLSRGTWRIYNRPLINFIKENSGNIKPVSHNSPLKCYLYYYYNDHRRSRIRYKVWYLDHINDLTHLRDALKRKIGCNKYVRKERTIYQHVYCAIFEFSKYQKSKGLVYRIPLIQKNVDIKDVRFIYSKEIEPLKIAF